MVDAVVIGAGHNGLVCAAYLAAAGLKVTVLERLDVVGGAAVTEEFHPGFRNSVASYTVSLLNPTIIRDLDLHAHGLRFMRRRQMNFAPMPDGRFLTIGNSPAETQASIAQFSNRDADTLPRYYAALDAAAELTRRLMLETPPNLGGGVMAAMRGLRLGERMRRLSMAERRTLLDVMTQSVGDLLDGWFESAAVKGVFGFDGVVGNMQSPYAPGSAYVLLHHAIGEVDGKKGLWAHAVGGMGAITQAMASVCRARGVVIETNAPVAGVLTRNGAAAGVVLEDGREIEAGIVVSNLNPKLLFARLVDPAVLDPEFRERMQRWRCRSGSFRMNVALDRLPEFTSKPNEGGIDHLTSGILITPSLPYQERAYVDARERGWSREPIVEILIPSILDDSLAPAGKHVASLFCQHFNPDLPDGASWDTHRETAADVVIDTVEHYAPGFKDSVIARQILSPLDLERRFGLVGGDIFHGALHLDQLFSARPMLGYADYRTPVRGLYQCGSGTHPGGGVSGAPGHNAAAEILADMRLRRLFRRAG